MRFLHQHTRIPVTLEVILESIRAQPESEERANRLSQIETIKKYANSGGDGALLIVALISILELDSTNDKAATIDQCVHQLTDHLKQSRAMFSQLTTSYSKILEKLKRYRDEEVLSRWSLESILPTEDAAVIDVELSLPPFEDVIRGYLHLEGEINEHQEINYLMKTIQSLTVNADKFSDLLAETETRDLSKEEKSLLKALKDSIENDIAEISGVIF